MIAFIIMYDFIKKGYDPLSLRYLYLTAHYRSKLNFSPEALSAAGEALRKIKDFFELSFFGKEKKKDENEITKKLKSAFWEAVNDDLNMPRALAALWSVFKSPLSYKTKRTIVLEFDAALGLGLNKLKPPIISPETVKILEERAALRNSGQFAKADGLRKKIEETGYKVEDTAGGMAVRKIAVK